MTTKLEIQMEIEKLDSEGYETIGTFDVNIEATYSKDNGDYWNPPYEQMDIESVTLDDGEDYQLSREEEQRAIAMLYEELAGIGDGRYDRHED
jgi:hypothetical protein